MQLHLEIFHSYDDFINAPPLRFAIAGFLQDDGITGIGGPPAHSKTWIMLCIARALLTGEPLFGYKHFQVLRPAERAVYLIPEAGLGPFKARLEICGLMDFVKDQRLLVHTLSHPESISLSDARLRRAIDGGADLFLDTAVRFLDGDENTATDAKKFAEQ